MPDDLSAWLTNSGIEPDEIGTLALPYHFGSRATVCARLRLGSTGS